MRSWLRRRLRSEVIDRFHNTYYRHPDSWPKNTFLGYPIQQCPLDLHLYQEIMVRHQPRFVLQTGVAAGGSLLYFASILDLMGADSDVVVVGVDVTLGDRVRSLSHPRIHLVKGSSTDADTVERVKELLPAAGGLVSLDSDHTQPHVAAELKIYPDLVAVGSYLVVEDTNINGHPVAPGWGPGPFEAVEEFLAEDNRFVRDDELWRRNLFSHHQYGWLKRVR
jgi:cephalosporin hydroxylase